MRTWRTSARFLNMWTNKNNLNVNFADPFFDVFCPSPFYNCCSWASGGSFLSCLQYFYLFIFLFCNLTKQNSKSEMLLFNINGMSYSWWIEIRNSEYELGTLKLWRKLEVRVNSNTLLSFSPNVGKITLPRSTIHKQITLHTIGRLLSRPPVSIYPVILPFLL